MMENQQDYLEPPPPYQAHSNNAYYVSDTDAWPSSYYRNTPRIDLAKFYHDILKASTDNSNMNNGYSGNQAPETTLRDRRVTFSTEDPEVFEYEAEYDTPKQSVHGRMLDDGWPGRAKTAMKSSAFIDFKSKIEAKLSAVNDDSDLISEINNNSSSSSNDTGYYRFRKSPLVQRLNLRPIPNENYGEDDDDEDDESSSSSSSPTSSTCESPPETPQDNQTFYFNSPRSSTSSSSSSLTRKMSWLRTLRLKSPIRSK